MSKKFVEGCFNLVFDFDGVGSIYEPFEQDKNYILLKELVKANILRDLEKYIELYSQYINDENIYNYYIYTLHPSYSST